MKKFIYILNNILFKNFKLILGIFSIVISLFLIQNDHTFIGIIILILSVLYTYIISDEYLN
jgi:uncharacterized membrane protein